MTPWPLLDGILESWAARAALTPEQVQAFGEEVKARAFTLARVWETRFLEDVQASLGKAMQDGTTLAAWLPTAQKLLDGYGGSVLLHGGGDRWAPWYADLVIRNAVQGSFAGGRYSAMFGPEWIIRAPYWRYHATLDARTRPTHAALHGKVFRKDDTAARPYLAPWSHGCRCQAIEMTLEEFDEGGYKVTDGTLVPLLPTRDGETVGRPEGGWDIDRVTATKSRVLGGATPPPA